MTQAIAKMLLVICADEVMIPMRPHPSGNKKRSPPILEENPSDRPCQILEGSDSEALRRNRLKSPKDSKNSHVHKLLDTYNKN